MLGDEVIGDSQFAMEIDVTVTAQPGLLCGHCGYDLRAIESRHCPECGRRFDPEKLLADRLPWEQRRFLGWLGSLPAYLRTLRLIVFQTSRAARAMEHPIDPVAARRFQWVTTLFAAVGLLLILWNIETFIPWTGSAAWGITEIALGSVVPKAISFVGLLFGTILIVRVGGLFFQPPRLSDAQKHRAVALSRYASAALALLPALVVLALIYRRREEEVWPVFYDYMPHERLFYAAVSLLLQLATWLLPVLLVTWWINTLILLKRSTGCGWGRVAVAGASLPLLWVGLPLIIIVGLHLIVAFIALIHVSFSL